MSCGIEIRRELRPGDLGEIVAFHGRTYASEYGVDRRFEGFVAAAVAEAGKRGFPNEREDVWIVERDGAMVGCLALTEDPDDADTGVVRWFVFEPSVRGRGLGRRLLGELVERAGDFGYERLRLETFSLLRAAAHLYRSFGFEVVDEDTAPRWGREEVTFQHYELEFAATARGDQVKRSSAERQPGVVRLPFGPSRLVRPAPHRFSYRREGVARAPAIASDEHRYRLRRKQSRGR